MLDRARPPTTRALLGLVLAVALPASPGCESARDPSYATPPAVSAAASASASTPPAATSSASPPPPAAPAIALRAGGKGAASSRGGMVSSAVAAATEVGVEVLRAGGNAVDAAVAVGYALAVTHLSAGGLGGGGFMIVRLANGERHAIDYREIAPKAATVARNEAQLAAGAHGWASAPVPGVVAGLDLARRRFGTRPLAELMAPAIALADRGFALPPRQAQMLGWYWRHLERDPVARAIFGRRDGKGPLAAGQRLKQPSLARTLRAIAEHDDAGFYQGEVADKIARAMKAGGGLVTTEDLAAYRVVVREPLHFTYRGFEVYTMPPPSMGGIGLALLMLGLDAAGAHAAAADTAESLHLFAEASRRAYADRRAVGGDPAFNDAAMLGGRLTTLLDPAYHRERKPPIDPARATPSALVIPFHEDAAELAESPDTTHFSVVDGEGNAVSCTTTLSAGFGSWRMAPETGVMFSNAMGAFSPRGVNTLAPGKRMSSSMTPTVVEQRGKVVALLGSPGGDTIPGTVAQVLRNLVDHGMTLDEAVRHGRIHQQHHPDVLRVETARAPSAAVLARLRAWGHDVQPNPALLGHANNILVDAATSTAYGYADDRQGGLAAGP